MSEHNPNIESKEGADIFELPVDAIVNPVNVLEAVMGAGLAKAFATKWPELLAPYRAACRSQELRIGTVMVANLPEGSLSKYVIHFPTKNSFKQPSQMSYIKEAMPALAQALKEHNIKSIAIPGLGCGYGELAWPEVETAIREGLKDLEDVKVILIPPRPQWRRGARR